MVTRYLLPVVAVAASYADRAVFLSDGRIVDDISQPTSDSVLDRIRTLGA